MPHEVSETHCWYSPVMYGAASRPERIIIELAEDKSLLSRVLVYHSRAGSYYPGQVRDPGPPASPRPDQGPGF